MFIGVAVFSFFHYNAAHDYGHCLFVRWRKQRKKKQAHTRCVPATSAPLCACVSSWDQQNVIEICVCLCAQIYVHIFVSVSTYCILHFILLLTEHQQRSVHPFIWWDVSETSTSFKHLLTIHMLCVYILFNPPIALFFATLLITIRWF